MRKIYLFLVLSVIVQSGMAQFSSMPLNYPTDGAYYSPNIMSIVDINQIWVGTLKQQPVYYYQPYSVAIHTLDGGNTWQFDPIPVAGSPYNADVEALDENNCYYLFDDLNTDSCSIWKTSNGGTTWSKKSTTQFAGGCGDFIHLFSQDTLIVIGDPTNGYFEIQISNDGGDTWNRVPQSNIPTPLFSEMASCGRTFSAIGNTLWFGSTNGRCFKSIDGGNHWTASMVHNSGSGYVWQVCFSDLLHGVFYSTNTVPASYYKTSDGGETWTLLPILNGWVFPSISSVQGITNAFIMSAQLTGPSYTSIFYTNNFFNTLVKIGPDIASTSYIYFKDAITGWLSGLYNPDPSIYKFNSVLTAIPGRTKHSENLSIVPNPTSQNTVITFPSALLGHEKTMRITDISGKLINEQSLKPNDMSLNLNSSLYLNGVYNIELISDDGLVNSCLWIINH